MKRLLPLLLLAGALAGSVYLLLRVLALLAGTQAADVCSAVFDRGCDPALKHPSSRQLGIPLAGWGVIYFASLLLLLLLARLLDDGFRIAANAAATMIALLGSAISVVLLVALLAGEVPLCPLCVAVNGLNLAALVPVSRWGGASLREQAASLGRGLRFLAGAKAGDRIAARWRVLGFVVVALFALAIYQWVLVEVDRSRSAGREFDPDRVIAQYEEAERQEIPVDPWNPLLGPAGAKARLVVFSDAFCPHCRSFWQNVTKLTQRYGGDLQIVFKHFPLDTPCNRSVPAPIHPGACAAAAHLEAARAQDKFWPYHDALLTQGPPRERDGFLRIAEGLGLDPERLRADIARPSTRAAVEGDVALGTRLGIVATPTFFLDGRRIEEASPRAVTLLLDRALGRGADRAR